MPFIDFAALKAAVPITDAAEALGLAIKREGTQSRAPCPACNSGGERAIVLTPGKGLFYCFAAKKGGDCIGLAAHVLGVGNNDAANFLADQLGTGNSTVKPDRETGTDTGTDTGTGTSTSTVSKSHATAPQKQEERDASASTAASARQKSASASFDPEKFGKSLGYDDQVKALGISEDNAARYRIGSKRGKLFIPICPPDVQPACWAELDGDRLRLPDKWLPSNVIRLKRPA